MRRPLVTVQLHMLRDLIAADRQGILDSLGAMDIRYVEVSDFVTCPTEVRARLARHGLTCSIGHSPLLSERYQFGQVVVDHPSNQRVFEAAACAGIEVVVDPLVTPDRWLDAEAIERTADRLNAACEQARGFGVRVGYHNHAHEFRDLGGITGYEYFVDRLAKDVVLELDVFWAATAGQDVEALLHRFSERVISLHVKDGVPNGVYPFGPGGVYEKANLLQTPAGAGELPITDYIRAVPKLEYAVVEFDHYPEGLLVGIHESVRYLRSKGLAL